MNSEQRRQLSEDAQYLNLGEMKAFCQAHDLPLYIHVERPDGRLSRTSDRDRKDVVLSRILEFALKGNRGGPTIYAKTVIASGPLPCPLTARTRIRYGQYEKKNAEFLATLELLTDGEFRTGMIARLVLRDFWTQGRAPTLKQFAVAWLRATREHTNPRPEGAYLVDLAQGTAGPNWKRKRIDRSKRALKVLEALAAR